MRRCATDARFASFPGVSASIARVLAHMSKRQRDEGT
jgi:hypothetical protein